MSRRGGELFGLHKEIGSEGEMSVSPSCMSHTFPPLYVSHPCMGHLRLGNDCSARKQKSLLTQFLTITLTVTVTVTLTPN